MLTLHQLTTAAIAHHANTDNSFHVKDFNLICNQITDYMAYANLCFTNVHLYLTRLHSIAPQLPAAIHKVYDTNGARDLVDYFNRFVSSIYTSLMDGNQVVADQVRWPMDGEGDIQFKPSFSKSIISIVPGKLVLDTNTSAMIADGKSTLEDNGYLKDFAVYRKVMTIYRHFSEDPVYGDSRFGIMPYVMPFIPPSFDKKIEDAIEYEYITYYNKARELFNEALVIKIEADVATRKFNEVEDSSSKEGASFLEAANALDKSLEDKTQKIAEALFDTLQEMAFDYNNGYTLTLPRKNYAISNNR